MEALAMWRRLDVPGHDAARLAPGGAGWLLEGCAVFAHEEGPACLRYAVELAPDWTAMGGTVRGFVGGRGVGHEMRRDDGEWVLDGARVPGLDGLVDLDFGFTPATNLPQVRRLDLGVGQTAELRVAWFDPGAGLSPLAQRYKRVDARGFRYASPRHAYEASLRLAQNGFVESYPGLWEMEA
jgi:hypothetical protein